MSERIHIKPHHFVDIIMALGRGQTTFEPHPCGHAVHTIAASLLILRDTPLEIELGADDICRPCKHNMKGLCNDTIDTSFRPDAPSSKRLYNLMIDRRLYERLSLAQGDRLSARQFCSRLRERAGDLTDIYREIPAAQTVERKRNL